MNFLDIIIVLPLFYFIYRGWRKGLIYEVFTLLGIVVGCYAAIHFSKWVSDLLGLTGETALLIAFFVTFVSVIVLAFLLGKVVEGFFKMVHLSLLNKLAGALLGMLKCLCIISVLLNWLLLIDRHEIVLSPTVKEQSVFFQPVYHTGTFLTSSLHKYVEEIVASSASSIINIRPEKQ